MPDLASLLTASGNSAELTYAGNPFTPVVEPLDGYTTVDQVLDRFPEEVYTQSRDSHLYKFLQALCGEAGAGQIKKQSYLARLKHEGSLLTFTDIDTFYTQHFQFPRLPDETYPTGFDPDSDILTKEEWDTLMNGDEKYRARIQLFMQATRLGNSPEGITLAAEAGSGIHCDVFENYRAYYDKLSDDPLGIQFQGVTNSLHEFVIHPRLINPDGTVDSDVGFTSTLQRNPAYVLGTMWAINTTYSVNDIVYPIQWNGHFYKITAQSGNSGATQPTWTLDGTSVTQGNITYLDIGTSVDEYFYDVAGIDSAPTLGSFPSFNPAIQHNMQDVLDNVRPTGALMTVEVASQHFIPITDDQGVALTPNATASTQNFHLARLVTGRLNVPWPIVDRLTGARGRGFFIQPGIENEQQQFPTVAKSRPVIWHTIDNTHAYTDKALLDPVYDQPELSDEDTFYGGSEPVYPTYRSEHIGAYQGDFALIFPFLQNAPTDNLFSASRAIAAQSTPLILDGRSK